MDIRGKILKLQDQCEKSTVFTPSMKKLLQIGILLIFVDSDAVVVFDTNHRVGIVHRCKLLGASVAGMLSIGKFASLFLNIS